MNRPSWNDTFFEICDSISKRSTCKKLQVASVIVKNNRIISIGYNGTPSGSEHCVDHFEGKSLDGHHKWSIANELHAERNAIYFAAKEGYSLNDTTLYTTYSPCIDCAKAILSSGIKEVFYKHLYKKGRQGLIFLYNNNVKCTLYDV